MSADPRDRSRATDLLRQTYPGGGWRDDELVEASAATPDVYVDPVSRVAVGPGPRAA